MDSVNLKTFVIFKMFGRPSTIRNLMRGFTNPMLCPPVHTNSAVCPSVRTNQILFPSFHNDSTLCPPIRIDHALFPPLCNDYGVLRLDIEFSRNYQTVKTAKTTKTAKTSKTIDADLSLGTKNQEITELQPVKYYQHYKGGIYAVIGDGIHTETEEELVFYYSTESLKLYARPKNMFYSSVPSTKLKGRTVKRFTLLS